MTGSYSRFTFNSLRNCQTDFPSGVPLHILTSSSTSLQTLGGIGFENFNFSSRCVEVSQVFDLHLPDDSWHQAPSHMVIGHLLVFPEESVQIFA